jgi:two-component system response regulator
MTQPAQRSVTILIADDDADDRQMTEEALRAARLANDLHFVENGVELIAYLTGTGAYSGAVAAPRPGLVLLDLNMPLMDGREALEVIKADTALRRIPIVILTTSKAEEDVFRSYDLGVSGYITKPVTFDGLVKAMSELGRYWFELVELPDQTT